MRSESVLSLAIQRMERIIDRGMSSVNFYGEKKGERGNVDEVRDERESDFAFVVKLVGALKRHNDENVELVFEHALRDFFVHTEIFHETQTCAMDIGVVNHHHLANGGELLLQIHLMNQLKVRLELLEIERNAFDPTDTISFEISTMRSRLPLDTASNKSF